MNVGFFDVMRLMSTCSLNLFNTFSVKHPHLCDLMVRSLSWGIPWQCCLYRIPPIRGTSEGPHIFCQQNKPTAWKQRSPQGFRYLLSEMITFEAIDLVELCTIPEPQP
jgi:hypothetical protein